MKETIKRKEYDLIGFIRSSIPDESIVSVKGDVRNGSEYSIVVDYLKHELQVSCLDSGSQETIKDIADMFEIELDSKGTGILESTERYELADSIRAVYQKYEKLKEFWKVEVEYIE